MKTKKSTKKTPKSKVQEEETKTSEIPSEIVDDVSEEIAEEKVESETEPIEKEPIKESVKSGRKDSNINPPDDIPPDEFDPLAEPVVQRDYTKFGLDFEDSGPETNEKIDEPSYTQPPNMGAEEVEFEDLSQGESNEGFGGESGGNEQYDDLSPQQKRRAAEKTADAILTAYAKFVPLPFKKLSSYDLKKLEQLEIEDELRMSMIVQEGNITIRDYVMQHNEQVEEVFTITDEMIADIKPPLQDVLMEQQLVLTPLQRLGLAVGGNLLTFTFAAVQLSNQKKEALKTFKAFHEESRQPSAPPNYEAPSSPSENASPKNNKEPEKPESQPQPPPTMDDYLTAEDPTITIESVSNEN